MLPRFFCLCQTLPFMSHNRQTILPLFLKLLLIDRNCSKMKSLLIKSSYQIKVADCSGSILFASCQIRLLVSEIVVLDTFSPNCPTGSLIDVYAIYVLSFFANCHGWNPVSGSPFLQIDVPDTFVMELHLSEGTLFWKLRNHITLRRPWPFKMELWFCRLEFGVKYLECGNVCRGWH